MDVSLTTEESTALRKAVRSYLSELRTEIVHTDNSEYKHELRDERAALESAVAKLDAVATRGPSAETATVTLVSLWWLADES